jgi:hypothetical protein
MALLISLINGFSNRACDLLVRPFRDVNPLAALTVFAFLTGAAMLLVYKFTSNQKAIRRAKDLMQAHVLAVRLFQDQLGVVLRAYGRILNATLGYLRHSLLPLAIMFVPLALLLVQLDARFAYRAARVGEPLLLTIRAAQAGDIEGVTLELPAEVALTAPLLRDAQNREVVARIEPEKVGHWTVGVKIAGSVYSKQLIVGDGLENLSLERAGPGLLDRILHPVEDPLPAAAPVESIAVNYPERRMTLGRFDVNWIVAFFILSLVAGFAMKRPLRAEF